MGTEVVISRCAEYGHDEVYAVVKKSVGMLGGMGRFARGGELILIKPNLLAGKPPEAAVTTHPSVVRAVIRLVKETGATPVVGDSPGMGNALKIAEKCGVMEVCRAEGVQVIDFQELVTVENPSGHTFKRLEVAKEALSFDGIINLPKLKTHAQMYLTLGVKNLFGCVAGKRKPLWHLEAGTDSLHFASMLLDLHGYLKPRLTIVDGITAMEGNGPGSGDPRRLGLIFSGASALAVDAVITETIGADAQAYPILRAAKERGARDADVSKITVLGEKLEKVQVKDFKFPPISSVNFTARLPYFMDKRLRKALTSRPRVNKAACTLCNICVNVCPPEVMKNSGRIEIDYDQCIRCYCCQEMCPQGAISPVEGWLKRIIPGL